MELKIEKTKGTLLILASVCFYSVMACLIKSISHISVRQITFLRFLIGLIILCLAFMGGKIQLKFTNRPLLLMRGLVGCTAIFITYLAIIKLGLVKGTVILYSYPVFASLFGAWFLKERLGWSNAAALALGLTGLYLLITHKNGWDGFFTIGLYEGVALLGAVLAGLAVVIIRKLHETETSWEIFFAQCAVGTAMLLGPGIRQASAVTARETAILLAIGLLATAGQLVMTQGFRYLPVKTGSLLALAEPVLNYLLGILIFAELVTFRSMSGSVLIAVACLIVLISREKT